MTVSRTRPTTGSSPRRHGQRARASTLDAATAYGIYPMFLDSTDGPNTWIDGFGVYVQGTGCAVENHTLEMDNDTPAYFIPQTPGDEMGNYFVVDSTAFTLTSVEAQLPNNAGPVSPSSGSRSTPTGPATRIKVWTSAWQAVSGTGVVTETFSLPTPLTFRQGDTFWVTSSPRTT